MPGKHIYITSGFYSAVFVYQLIGIIVLLIILLYLLLKKVYKERDERKTAEEKTKDMKLRLQLLELETMKHKLNPHLFKNVLNSIQSHAYQTYQALDKLSGVLDYILYESDRQLVSVKQELAFAQNLIDINRLKLSPLFDLRTKIRIDDSDLTSEEDLITPMICAPLIENAFKHADIQSEDAFIAINLEYHSGVMRVQVANKISDKPALRKEKSGIGTSSLEKRLEVVYGSHYKMEKEVKDKTYKVFLKIDLLGYKNTLPAGG